MFKKAALFLTLMLLLPTLASAYTIAVKVGSGSGSVIPTAPTAGAAITSSGSVSVAGTANEQFTLTPGAGYTVSKILLDNVAVYDQSAVTPLPNGPTSYTVSYNSAKLIRTLTVYYSVQPSYYTVSVSPAPTGGYVLLQKVVNINGTWQASGSSSQTTLGSLKLGDNVRITAVPGPSYSCTNFQVNGGTNLATGNLGEAASTIYTVTSSPANATVTANFTISGSITAALKASSTQVAVGAPVTLDATGTTGNVAFTYGFASSPSTGVIIADLSPAVAGKKTFTASAAGTYTVTMTATGTPNGTGSASVVIKVLSAVDYTNQQCTACHATSTPALVTNYGASVHETKSVSCDNCHNAAASHPGTVSSKTVSAKSFMNLSSVYDNGRTYTKGNFCSTCHSSQATEFFVNSPHWNNLRNNGDSAVVGDGKGSCATNKCHFNGTAAPSCNTCHSGALVTNLGDGITSTLGNGTFDATKVKDHGIVAATQETTCFICHTGSHHGSPTATYQKSAHYLNPYYMYGDKVVTCTDCHNPHSTEASFTPYDATTYAKAGNGSCDAAGCHVRTAGKPYGIFSSTGMMMQPHAAYKVAPVKNVGSTTTGWYSGTRNVYYNVSSSYVTPNNTCADCHGHNNYINGEYAETMHADPYGRWKGTQYFKYRGFSSASITHANSATDGCVRCHTTTGFVNFVESGFSDLRAWGFQNTADKTAEVITCRACHVTTKGAISGEAEVALPEGNINGWNPASIRAYNKPYPAYYNYSSKLTGKYINSTKGATGTALQYRDFKNSNVCVPCHSGRSGSSTNGDVIKALASFSGFTTLGVTGNSVPGTPHGVWQAAVLDGKIGYQFTKYTTAANGHATIGVGGVVNTGTTSGPCVGCHMTTKTQTGENGKTASYRKHSFEIVDSNGNLPSICANCHSTGFNGESLDAAKAKFQAAVSALGEIMANPSLNKYGVAVVYYDPSTSIDKSSYKLVMPSASRMVAASLTPAQNAELAGAYFNLKMLYGMAYGTGELGDWAHNPQYLKQLTNDTINAVRAASTGSVDNAISMIPVAATGTVAGKNSTAGFTAAQQQAAAGYVTNVNNHYATGDANGYKVQYVLKNDGSECANCHNPAETAIQAEAREMWAESGHGSTTVAPWTPSSSHAWRNAGATTDFSQVIPKNDCQRCHTTDGYAQFVGSNFTNINPVADATTAKTNSPLACNACHSDNSFARRAVPAVSTFYNISSVDNVTKQTVKVHLNAQFPDAGDSNICISCHSARVSGAAIVQAAANGLSMSNAGFQNSHYMGAAGLMYVKAGFTAFTSAFAAVGSSTTSYGQTLTSSADMTVDVNNNPVAGGVTSTHRKFGTADMATDSHTAGRGFITGGPCVTCHMAATGAAARPGAGHTLEIDAAAASTVCNVCHASENGNNINLNAGATIDDFKAYFLEPQSEVFQNALGLAKTLLLNNYHISYDSASYPYYYDEDLPLKNGKKQAVTDWTRGGALSSAAALKLHGACFNINLLSRDPAAFAHARTYVRRLVYDTIDFLDNGAMDLSVGNTAVTTDSTTYVKGATATDPATTESMTYLLNYDRTSGAWKTPERP